MELIKVLLGSAVIAAILAAIAAQRQARWRHRADLEVVDRGALHKLREANHEPRLAAHRALAEALDEILAIARWHRTRIKWDPPADGSLHPVRAALYQPMVEIMALEREAAFLASPEAEAAAAAAVKAADALSVACMLSPPNLGDTSCAWYPPMVEDLATACASYRTALRADIGAA